MHTNNYSTIHQPISFVIITYNRPADTLALLQNLSGLENTDRWLRAIVLVNNCSTEDYAPVKEWIAAQTTIHIQYIDAPENLGVSKGRNFALQFTDAPILVLLDDDAELENANALEAIVQAFEKPAIDGRKIGVVSFLVKYYENRMIQKNAFPHKKFDKYHFRDFFYTYYYAGGAHAVLREVLDEIGHYPNDFFYGMEEYDLSYRMLEKGWSIAFSSSVIMLHKESPFGRTTRAEKWKMMWINKSKVAYRYLPRIYFYSTTVLWSLQYLRSSGWDWKGFREGWKMVLKFRKTERRQPLSGSTLQYLKQVEARLWY